MGSHEWYNHQYNIIPAFGRVPWFLAMLQLLTTYTLEKRYGISL